MENLPHSLQSGLVDEILLKDKNFFTSRNFEFNIFRYTSIFAVFAFSIQIIVGIFGYINVTGYFTFVQFASYFISLIGLMMLLILYSGLTFVIRRTISKSTTYLKSYACEKSDYFSFSSFNSLLHSLSNIDHSIKERTVLLKQCRSIVPMQLKSFVDWFPDILKKEERSNKDEFGEKINYSGEKINGKHDKEYLPIRREIFVYLVITAIISIMAFILRYSLIGLLMLLAMFTIIFVVLSLSLNLVAKEFWKEMSDVRVYFLLIKMEEGAKQKSSLLKFKIFPCNRRYFEENLTIGYLDEKIETLKGPIYIVDTVVWNKYWQLAEINT